MEAQENNVIKVHGNVPAMVASESQTMLQMIMKASNNKNLDVAKLEKLLDMQERIMAKQAEVAYNTAMAALQAELPAIQKTSKAHNSTYAKYEDIDKILKPVYSKHGFSLSFDSEKKENITIYYGKASHSQGHFEVRKVEFPADTSGSKNAIQAIVSSGTYAKRALVGMLFNIVTSDDVDNDGNNQDQPTGIREGLEQKIKNCKTQEELQKLCNETKPNNKEIKLFVDRKTEMRDGNN